jgi:hypothetical protein
MKLSFTVVCFLLALPMTGGAQEQANVESPQINDYKFDEWDDIPFDDEKVRLDFIAQALQLAPEKIVYMEINAGKRACVGEAQARAVRAQNYLVRQKKINADRIKWRDGGYREEVTIMVWLVPPDWPILADQKVFTYLKPTGVKFDKKCKIKYRGKK